VIVPGTPSDSPANGRVVETAGIEPALNSRHCEEWTGALNSKGYGVRTINSRRWLAHRAAYALEHGPLEPGVQLHHTCGNRRCVNVAHLKPVSALEHNRSHLASQSAAQFIEAQFADGHLHIRRRRELVAAAAAVGISAGAIGNALLRMPNIRRVGRGLYAWRHA
jgi:hypothetical protein